MSTTGDAYLGWLRDLLAPLGRISIRRMFDGASVQVDGHMIAIAVDETLWLKVDDGNRAEFETLGLPRFYYERLGKTVAMNFYQPPEDALESTPEMLRWAKSALGAALRSGVAAKPRARPKGAKTAQAQKTKARATRGTSAR